MSVKNSVKNMSKGSQRVIERSQVSINADKANKINWEDYNYPPIMSMFHYDDE